MPSKSGRSFKRFESMSCQISNMAPQTNGNRYGCQARLTIRMNTKRQPVRLPLLGKAIPGPKLATVIPPKFGQRSLLKIS